MTSDACAVHGVVYTETMMRGEDVRGRIRTKRCEWSPNIRFAVLQWSRRTASSSVSSHWLTSRQQETTEWRVGR